MGNKRSHPEKAREKRHYNRKPGPPVRSTQITQSEFGLYNFLDRVYDTLIVRYPEWNHDFVTRVMRQAAYFYEVRLPRLRKHKR